MILVSHAAGGGTAHAVASRAAALAAAGHRAVVLTPGADGSCVLDGRAYALPRALPALVRALAASRPVWLEQHHLQGHAAAVSSLGARLGIPTRIWLHDYATICPRTSLAGPDGRYCGEPPVRACVACLRACGEPRRDVAALRARSARALACADEVLTPSADTAARIRRHFPAIVPTVAPGDDVRPPPAPGPIAGPLRVCIVGAIDRRKGLDVLLGCARDAAQRDLPLLFEVVGFSIDDAALLATGRVRISGLFDEAECQPLIARAGAHIGFVPSVWPETWCFALSHLWQAGLPTVAFDLGAQGERVRAAGGMVLPPALPPARINDALLAYPRGRR